MTDSLQQSVRELDTPQCPDCHIKMVRYRSILASDILPQTVAHFFQCANCGRVEEIQTRVSIIGPILRARDFALSEVRP
jgi:hypothetical protein